MLFSTLFRRGNAKSAPSAARQHRSTSLRVERLEDRTVPSGIDVGLDFVGPTIPNPTSIGDTSHGAVDNAPSANPSSAVALSLTAEGTGNLDPTFSFTASGTASHLGKFTHYGTLTVTPTTDPDVFLISGITTYEAANGDKLYASLEGTLNQATGVATGIDTWIGGNPEGRFANATGSASVTAQLLGLGAFEFTVNGDIQY